MIVATFAIGCLIITCGLVIILHNAVGIFPFDIPYFEDVEDVTTIVVIGVALVALAFIFRIPIKK